MSKHKQPPAKPGPKPKPALKSHDIHGLKYFKLIQQLLESLHEHRDCHNRRLHYDQLAALVILYFFNPVLTSLRSIRQASTLRNVQRKLGVKRTSLGSLSESSRVFDPALLAGVIEELAARTSARDAHKRPSKLVKELSVIAVDGSLLRALRRMAWALWVDDEHRAAKLHLEFDILRGIPKSGVVSHANANEKQVLRDKLTAGRLYVLDGGYAKYELFEEIRSACSSFIARLHGNAAWELIDERPLTEPDKRAGVVFDRIVRLGSAATRDDLSAPVRVVKIHVKSASRRGMGRWKSKEYDILLATDRMDVPAEVIGLLYQWRWTIELFFRWFKCVLRFQHLIFESKRGVEIMVYCALIASLLITLWTGRKPTKRTLEMVQLYFQGWAELDELEAHIAGLDK